jgi:L-2-hydroxyglutarate oxidase LhgO
LEETVEAIVIGAGVIGLACARALALAGHEVIIIERHATFGSETSSRNSEVIHAGIYYPAGTDKARYCVAGKAQLYQFCATHGVAHRACGKLIVATSAAQEHKLHAIRERAIANGVHDLRLLTAAQATALEPEVTCVAALLSPSTGIIDSHAFMLALLGDAESHGAVLALQTSVEHIAVTDTGFTVQTGGQSPMRLHAKIVINAAGLGATDVAHKTAGLPTDVVPLIRYAKGNYFSLPGKAPFSRLVYPVPEPGGLGVHYTLDLGGGARFGPDVQWVESVQYHVDPQRSAQFYTHIRQYWPALKDHALQADYAGIRPKLVGPHEADADFMIQGPARHGVPGLVNLFGIESPGLTGSLAIADAVLSMLNATA